MSQGEHGHGHHPGILWRHSLVACSIVARTRHSAREHRNSFAVQGALNGPKPAAGGLGRRRPAGNDTYDIYVHRLKLAAWQGQV